MKQRKVAVIVGLVLLSIVVAGVVTALVIWKAFPSEWSSLKSDLPALASRPQAAASPKASRPQAAASPRHEAALPVVRQATQTQTNRPLSRRERQEARLRDHADYATQRARLVGSCGPESIYCTYNGVCMREGECVRETRDFLNSNKTPPPSLCEPYSPAHFRHPLPPPIPQGTPVPYPDLAMGSGY